MHRCDRDPSLRSRMTRSSLENDGVGIEQTPLVSLRGAGRRSNLINESIGLVVEILSLRSRILAYGSWRSELRSSAEDTRTSVEIASLSLAMTEKKLAMTEKVRLHNLCHCEEQGDEAI